MSDRPFIHGYHHAWRHEWYRSGAVGAAKSPNLKVLFCLGNAENAFIRRDALAPGTAFVSKLYDRIKLATILRKVRAIPFAV
jgi:hypothetical protein